MHNGMFSDCKSTIQKNRCVSEWRRQKEGRKGGKERGREGVGREGRREGGKEGGRKEKNKSEMPTKSAITPLVQKRLPSIHQNKSGKWC